MDMKRSKKLLACVAAAYWVLVILVYLVAHPQFRYSGVTSDALSANTVIGEIVDGTEIIQQVTVPAQELRSISLMTATYDRENQGSLVLTLSDAQGNELAQQTADISAFADGKYTTITLDEPISGKKDEKLQLAITSQGCSAGNAVTIYAGNAVTAGRFEIVKNITEEERYQVNGQAGMGMLCVKLGGVNALSFYKTYWLLVAGAFAVAAVLCRRWWEQAKQKKNNPLVAMCTMCTRYDFLIKQLVSRDFKAKYKRSVLGVFWSFLNPLVTMCVQYVVFSTLFKSDIPNYPVYLLTGIVFMNFFTESISMGMTAITGNASLIKKVYMPKYIYPVSRVVSSLINFVIALVPLMLVMLLTGIVPRPALLLLLFDVLCLLGFVVGMSLLLTTSMTFFQDTQFLWNIASMMWTYVTPVFYPASIIPSKLMPIYCMNPMYQYITFARTCIIDGVSPGPMSYLWCIVSAVVVLLMGIAVFRKNQDRFVLYL